MRCTCLAFVSMDLRKREGAIEAASQITFDPIHGEADIFFASSAPCNDSAVADAVPQTRVDPVEAERSCSIDGAAQAVLGNETLTIDMESSGLLE